MTQTLYTEGSAIVNTKTPAGPLEGKWEKRKFDAKLINPANRHKLSIIMVGTGLVGGTATALLDEMGYSVKTSFYQDSARRTHSITAQGGINAMENYKNDDDSVYRLFYDTIKGEDFRAREANVYRLAEVANSTTDRCVAQGIPFTREYGEYLGNRSSGGVRVSRAFYTRGQAGQQLLIGAYQALQQQAAVGTVESFSRHEMMELIVKDNRTRGIVAYDVVIDRIESHVTDIVVLATDEYGSAFFLSANAMGCNGSAIWHAYRKGAYFTNPCYTQIHPTCIPQHGDYQSKLMLMPESLRNNGRIWVPKQAEDCEEDPRQTPEENRDCYLERIYPSFGNLVPRDIASRQARNMCDEGHEAGPRIDGVTRDMYLDFPDTISRTGKAAISVKCGNLFDMYKRITDDDPCEVPMRIYPAVHYTMDGLWVDYNLESSAHDLYVAGKVNFSDRDASHLGASALMQGLADGYFALSDTMGDYLASGPFEPLTPDDPVVVKACGSVRLHIAVLVGLNSEYSVGYYYKELGSITWERCGMVHEVDGLRQAIHEVRALREDFWKNVKVPDTPEELDVSFKKVGRVADFLELGELVCIDALHCEESCGGHFRVEPQTPEGEVLRRDDKYAYVTAWEFTDDGGPPILHKEDLGCEFVYMKQRSYK